MEVLLSRALYMVSYEGAHGVSLPRCPRQTKPLEPRYSGPMPARVGMSPAAHAVRHDITTYLRGCPAAVVEARRCSGEPRQSSAACNANHTCSHFLNISYSAILKSGCKYISTSAQTSRLAEELPPRLDPFLFVDSRLPNVRTM